MTSHALVIIHFAPLEYYPPIQNLLNELAKKCNQPTIVFTSPTPQNRLSVFKPKSYEIILLHLGISLGNKSIPFIRYCNYVIFFSSCLLRLIWLRPKRILYFETISSLPAYLYKRFFYSRCEILIHYHEYTTPQEYQNGMTLTRYFHRFEKWLYPQAKWVSHTNAFRMNIFKNDIAPTVIRNAHILPNYPPRNWAAPPKQVVSLPLRVVYAGALSLTTMYTEAFARWIESQQGKVLWDVYAYNFTPDAKHFLNDMKSPWINLKQGVEYNRLPEILKKYDVGVILYSGHIANYVYNAPNKLFEYLACGLDVWFPQPMVGSLEYVDNKTMPKISALDFTDLKDVNVEKIEERPSVIRQSAFYCDEALAPLIKKLTD
jgi:hypothetical protein